MFTQVLSAHSEIEAANVIYAHFMLCIANRNMTEVQLARRLAYHCFGRIELAEEGLHRIAVLTAGAVRLTGDRGLLDHVIANAEN